MDGFYAIKKLWLKEIKTIVEFYNLHHQKFLANNEKIAKITNKVQQAIWT